MRHTCGMKALLKHSTMFHFMVVECCCGECNVGQINSVTFISKASQSCLKFVWSEAVESIFSAGSN